MKDFFVLNMWFLLCALILSIQGQRFWVSLCRTPCLSLAQGKGLIESGSYLDKRKLLTDFCCGEQVDNASTRDVLRFHGAKSSKGCLMMLVSMHGRFHAVELPLASLRASLAAYNCL